VLHFKYRFSIWWSLPIVFFLGFYLVYFVDHASGTSGGAAAVSMGIMMVLLVQATIAIFTAFVCAEQKKQSSIATVTTLIFLLGGLIGWAFDYTFIEPHEIGEKGNWYIHSEYPKWRILE